jgi:glucuronokinase
VVMDFDKEHMQQQGHGRYTRLAPSLLPPLHLVYCENPSESGKVHSAVKQRWLAGEQLVVDLLGQVAQCAEEGRWGGRGRRWCMLRGPAA